MKTIAAIDDDPSALDIIRAALTQPGRTVLTFTSPEEALRSLESQSVDLILCDLDMPGMNGIEVIRICRARFPESQIVILTGCGGVREAVVAMKAGAADFFTKPLRCSELAGVVERILELQQAARRTRAEARQSGSHHPGMAEVLKMARTVAVTDSAVLITGETGVGKEVLADFLQRHSLRSAMPYVKVNCAGLPESLIESELFGHEKGSFTGAADRRIGRFERAHRGTIFLDEIAELSMPLQAKLLRVLQSHEIERVGGELPIRVDFRLLCATHRDLPAMVKQGSFRQDLYYRINVFPLRIPPLRERVQDIAELALEFVRRVNEARKDHSVSLSKEALEVLTRHAWPGNVRELENAIARASAIVSGPALQAKDFWWLLDSTAAAHPAPLNTGTPGPHPFAPETASADAAAPGALPPLRNPLKEAERQALIDVLQRNKWNFTKAALELKVSRSTLYAKTTRYGVKRG